MLQAEYYVVERENNNHNPLFSWDQKENEYGLGVPVPFTEPLKFRLRNPISKTLEWADFHEAPEPVISIALANTLKPLNIYGVQLIPAKVRNPNDPFAELHDYFLMHVWNRITCLDMTLSDVISMKSGMIFSIDKFVIDEAMLEKVELKKRLIFELAEKTSILLMHQSIKDAIESIGPKGIRFIPATQWNSDSTFD